MASRPRTSVCYLDYLDRLSDVKKNTRYKNATQELFCNHRQEVDIMVVKLTANQLVVTRLPAAGARGFRRHVAARSKRIIHRVWLDYLMTVASSKPFKCPYFRFLILLHFVTGRC